MVVQLGVRCVSAGGNRFRGTPGWRAAVEGANGTAPTPSSETTLNTYFEVRRSQEQVQEASSSMDAWAFNSR